MIVLNCYFNVRPENALEYERISRELSAEVRAKEPGVVFYELTRSRDTPTRYHAIEVYADEAALAAHSQTPYLKAALAKLVPLVDGAFDVKFHETV